MVVDWLRRTDTRGGRVMDIAGMGTHIVECLRVSQLIDQHADAFLDQVYTPSEQIFCRDRKRTLEHYAAIWAAKEAVFRSLGTTWRKGVDWKDVEILCDNPVEPTVVFTGPTRELVHSRGVKYVLVTLAHCQSFATATALALRG